MQDFHWLHWAQQLQAVAQTGGAYANNDFDRQRYDLVRDIAAAMIAAGTGAAPQVIADLFKREGGYATPRMDVRAAVFREGRILMVQERSDGLWALPGGFADVGDSPSARRSVRFLRSRDLRSGPSNWPHCLTATVMPIRHLDITYGRHFSCVSCSVARLRRVLKPAPRDFSPRMICHRCRGVASVSGRCNICSNIIVMRSCLPLSTETAGKMAWL